MRSDRRTLALPRRGLWLCLALAFSANVQAGADDKAMRLLEKMNARLEALERRNAELEQKLLGKTQTATPAIDARVRALENEQARVTRALDSDTISENEPELTYRLKAAEKDALAVKKAAHKIDALDGLQAGLSLSNAAQWPKGLPAGTDEKNGQLNYRADVTVQLPLDPIGDIEQRVFAHVRIGQGQGLNAPLAALGAFASAPNALAFRASGANPDDSVAILGQAFYQASVPLPIGGFKPRSRETLEVTFGKMDLFGFFDQNKAAGDEGRQFINSVFVHNPLLDAGGEIGVDANGFQPGFVLSYFNQQRKPESWRVSLGVFGSGPRGSNYQRSLSSPLIMAQAETSLRLFDGLAGNFRIYGWQRSQGMDFDDTVALHRGFGISADQRIGDGVTVFARYGRQLKGRVRFDRALTVGAELQGLYWSRGADAIGIAAAALHSSGDLRAAGASGDMNGDGTADFSYTPSGAERLLELYYRYRITKQFEVSPNLQLVSRLGANPDANLMRIFGVRAQINF